MSTKKKMKTDDGTFSEIVVMGEPQRSQVTQLQRSYSEVIKRQENNLNVFKPVNFPFVNRKEEILITISYFIITLWLQREFPTSWLGKKTVFSDQVWGSGKTWFGLNLIHQASLYEVEISQRLAAMNLEDSTSGEKFSEWYPMILKRILKCKRFPCTGSSSINLNQTLGFLERILQENPRDDIFFHIDESSDVIAIREIWIFLNNAQYFNLLQKEIRLVVFYFSGKQTLLNKVCG